MKTIFACILGGLCFIWLVWALFAWGSAPSFDKNISAQTLKNLFAQRGLKTCSEHNFSLDKTPGFVAGKTVSLSTNCGLDADPLKVSMIQFDSEDARNAAQQRMAVTHRNGYGPHFAYSYGPYVVSIQGTRGIGEQVLLGKVLSKLDD